MRILILHSVYGLRPAVHDAAARLEAAGHVTHAPDLYGGSTANTRDEGLALRDSVGLEVLLDRALAEAEAWAPDALLGFSMGASLSQRVALRRGGTLPLVLFHGTAEPADRGVPGLRILAHVANDDPFEPDEELESWHTSFVRNGASVELHRYPGGHLFTDAGLTDFNAQSAEKAWDTTLRWLA